MSQYPEEPKPVDISANREAAQIKIKWSNGEESLFSFDLVRNSCPCAECRGGHANMKSEPDDSMFIIPLMDAKTTQLAGMRSVLSGGMGIPRGSIPGITSIRSIKSSNINKNNLLLETHDRLDRHILLTTQSDEQQ